jgi:hypothetical protein
MELEAVGNVECWVIAKSQFLDMMDESVRA